MPSFRLVDDTGTPLTTALATGLAFAAYRDRNNVARTPPTISHRGEGLYSFIPTAADYSDGVGYLIECGTGANPPRGAGFVGDEHVFFAGYDAAGAFLAGLTPTITTYVKPDGSPATPIPTVVALALGLYAFTPLAADRINGVRFAIDLGAGAVPNRYPGGDLGDGFTVAAEPSPTPVDFTVNTDTAAPKARALAFNLETGTFIRSNGRITFVADRAAIGQAVAIHLQSFRGEWFLDIFNGLPYFDQILVKAPNMVAIEQTLRREIESVPGIKAVKTLNLTRDRVNRTLSVTWVADSDLGELKGTETLSP
jgi:hypothetical protein